MPQEQEAVATSTVIYEEKESGITETIGGTGNFATLFS